MRLGSRGLVTFSGTQNRNSRCIRLYGSIVISSDTSNPLVLVVEDEPLIRMQAADMVRDLGFPVIEAPDADRAISLLETVPEIAIVFSDIQMPGSLDGLRLFAVIRERWPPVGLLLTSGQIQPSDADLPRGTRFIPKPYLAHHLRTHLSAIMRQAQESELNDRR